MGSMEMIKTAAASSTTGRPVHPTATVSMRISSQDLTNKQSSTEDDPREVDRREPPAAMSMEWHRIDDDRAGGLMVRLERRDRVG